MNVFFSVRAEKDIIEIEDWYQNRNELLPEEFHMELFELLEFIARSPQTGIKLKDGSRLFRLTQFPYYVICDIESDSVVVVHILHKRRHPKLVFQRIK